jgi:predicted PurR-regulated permease PerM
MLDGLGTWLKAQLTLMAVTFFELSLGLSLLKIKSPILIAALTAIIDSLPVLGTGIILIPWAIISLILGSKIKALGLICLYIIVTAVHSVLEPKLVSVGFGVNPAATLLFSYLGLKLCGAVGMVIFPLILMMVKTLNDKGYIHLWR